MANGNEIFKYWGEGLNLHLDVNEKLSVNKSDFLSYCLDS